MESVAEGSVLKNLASPVLALDLGCVSARGDTSGCSSIFPFFFPCFRRNAGPSFSATVSPPHRRRLSHVLPLLRRPASPRGIQISVRPLPPGVLFQRGGERPLAPPAATAACRTGGTARAPGASRSTRRVDTLLSQPSSTPTRRSTHTAGCARKYGDRGAGPVVGGRAGSRATLPRYIRGEESAGYGKAGQST